MGGYEKSLVRFGKGWDGSKTRLMALFKTYEGSNDNDN